MKNQRYGIALGKKRLFTHYNPTSHTAWTDEILVKYNDGTSAWGFWIPYDMIEWC